MADVAVIAFDVVGYAALVWMLASVVYMAVMVVKTVRKARKDPNADLTIPPPWWILGGRRNHRG